MAHARMQLGTADEQLRHLGMVAALGIAFQRMGKIFLQFIVHTAPDKERPLLFLRVFPIHLPEQKRPEFRPEMKTLDIVVAEHGRVALQPVQQLPCMGIAAYHPGHFQVKALKGSQFQQEPADEKVEAPVNGCLKIKKNLPERVCHHIRPEGTPLRHTAGRHRHTQRMTDGFLQNSGDLRFRHRHVEKLKTTSNIFPVKE